MMRDLANQAFAKESSEKTILKGATIISLVPDWPTAFVGDILIDGDRIAEIGLNLSDDAAEVVELTDRIIIPGLVNAHMHTWQTGLRGACADWALFDYLREMHENIGPRFKPEDVRVATLAGALNQLACGTTTIGDWCHNNPTPEHSDAAIEGLRESGARAVFLHGAPKPLPKAGQPHFSKIPQSRIEIERLYRSFDGNAGIVTLGMAILGPHFSVTKVAVEDLALARELNIVASMHENGGPAADDEAWDVVEAEGLVGPKMNLVHANHVPQERLVRLVSAGATFTSTPEVELSMGHGVPVADRLVALGAMPSLGVDVESVISGEMLTVARFALSQQRAAAHVRGREVGTKPRLSSSIEALRWATQAGAQALGLVDRIGSLSPGMDADLVVVDARALNLTPVHDPVATALQASVANIEAVMVRGTWRKRNGRLVYGDEPALREMLIESGNRILNSPVALTA
jgi:cytosine/adenosine deaminase-related metal-dependent hydrolase